MLLAGIVVGVVIVIMSFIVALLNMFRVTPDDILVTGAEASGLPPFFKHHMMCMIGMAVGGGLSTICGVIWLVLFLSKLG